MCLNASVASIQSLCDQRVFAALKRYCKVSVECRSSLWVLYVVSLFVWFTVLLDVSKLFQQFVRWKAAAAK